MPTITHPSARRRILLVPILAASLLSLATPAVHADVFVSAGHGPIVGTVTWSEPPIPFTDLPQSFHQDATAVAVVAGPEGQYAGPMSIAADATSINFGSFSADDGTVAMTASGSSPTGDTFSCRAPGSTADAPQPMPGYYQRIGVVLIVGVVGVCRINGVDAPPDIFSEYGTLVPTGVSSDPGLSSAAFAGVLWIGNF